MRKKVNKKLLDLEVRRLTNAVLKGSCCGGGSYMRRWYEWLCARCWGYGSAPTSCTSCSNKEGENTGCSGTYYK